jgi:hypothetical protein
MGMGGLCRHPPFIQIGLNPLAQDSQCGRAQDETNQQDSDHLSAGEYSEMHLAPPVIHF